MKSLFIAVLALWLLPFAAFPAAALSRDTGPIEASRFATEAITGFAKRVEREAARRHARVFLIARQGRAPEELPREIEYTHTAFAVYSMIELEDGRKIPGYAIYNLYQDNESPERSRLVVDYPAEYFFDVFALKAAIVVPIPALQERLLDVLTSDTYADIHNPRYSAISNPFNSRFQNCTEHALDVINAAIYGTSNVAELKRYASAFFKPQKVHVGPLRLLAGSVFSKEIALSDHRGPVYTATFTTLRQYLRDYGLVESEFEVVAPDKTPRTRADKVTNYQTSAGLPVNR